MSDAGTFLIVWIREIGAVHVVEEERPHVERALRFPDHSVMSLRTTDGGELVCPKAALVACSLSTPEMRRAETLMDTALQAEQIAAMREAGLLVEEEEDEPWRG